MSSDPAIIKAYNGIHIAPLMLSEAKVECDSLNLDTTASYKVFQPQEKCIKIIDCVKHQCVRTAEA